MSVRTIIEQRQLTHGEFAPKAAFTQAMKDAMRATPLWSELSPGRREALDMIALKIGRTLYGDPNHLDNWVDVAGYAILGEKAA